MADQGPRGGPGAARVRLLALDVDGTLLTSRHEVTPAVAAAVRRAAAAGVRVVLTTARPPRGVLPVLSALADSTPREGPDGTGSAGPVAWIITSQGAFTGRFEPDGSLVVVDREPMPVAAALACVASVPPGVSTNWYVGERWLVEQLDPIIEREAAIVGFRPEVVDLSNEVDGPDKLLLLASDDATHLLDGVRAPEGLVAVRSTPTHLEVTRAGVDKATALARLCVGLGVDLSEVAAMGDGRNDLPMLAMAGIALVPANAAPEVRDAADVVTAGNDADGVADAIGLLLGS